MASLLRTLFRALTGQRPKLICSAALWTYGLNELHRRTGERRESGAFLLGTEDNSVRTIRQFLFYDDVDPTCFSRGIVEFNGGRFGEVWKICRDSKMTVVADVHVHPGGYAQSHSDQHNPMIAEAGHIALIIPNFSRHEYRPGNIGIYEYLGARQWQDHSAQGERMFHVGWWPQ